MKGVENMRENRYDIDRNCLYWMLMTPLHQIPGLPFGYTSSTDETHWVKCFIDESHYKLSDNYKVTLMSTDNNFGKRDFYQSDFMDYLKDGVIVKDTGQHVEYIEEYVSLAPNVYMKQTGYVLAQ